MRVGEVFGRDRVALLTADQAAALDRRAREVGAPERALMENAGRAAAEVIHRLHPTGRIVAVVGGGNNGGDALVALRSLLAWGRRVAWMPAGAPPDPALLAGFDLSRLDAHDAEAAFADAAVLVDGILGTGARGAPRDGAAALIGRMNESERPIVALDIPSGVDPTTAEVPGAAVSAHATIAFGAPKKGTLFHPGRHRCGRVIAVEIGFPPVADDEAAAFLITPDWARTRLLERAPDSHKNAVGRVTVVAGQRGMAGAAAIAGRSAVRAGAGYVRMISNDANRAVIQSLVPEGLFIDRDDPGGVRDAVAASDAVLIGPGIGTADDGAALLDTVLGALDGRACVLDADALTILAGRDSGLDALGGRFVLTPHPGEMSRLTGLAVGDVRRDPIERARALAGRTGAVVLLKGQPSVVADSGGRVMVNTVGSSDLASAAMGDQLGGLITAFAGGGAEPAVAAALGLFYGGLASELASRRRGLTPDDVADQLHHAFERPGPETSPLELPFVVFDQPARW